MTTRRSIENLLFNAYAEGYTDAQRVHDTDWTPYDDLLTLFRASRVLASIRIRAERASHKKTRTGGE